MLLYGDEKYRSLVLVYIYQRTTCPEDAEGRTSYELSWKVKLIKKIK